MKHLIICICIILCLVFLNYVSTSEGPACFACDRELDPYSCTKIKRCLPEQKCFSTFYTDYHSGQSFWDTNCKTIAFCNAIGYRLEESHEYAQESVIHLLNTSRYQNKDEWPEGSFSKRDDRLTICSTCCSGDYCNIRPCEHKQANKPIPLGLTCLSCSDVKDPVNCTKTANCKVGQLCSVWTNAAGLVSMGCKDKSICDAEGDQILYGKRNIIEANERISFGTNDVHALLKRQVSNTGCYACCDTNFCSAQYCSKYNKLPYGVSTVTVPTTTTTTPQPIALTVAVSPDNLTATEGDKVTFTCLINGEPPLDVKFALTDQNNSVTYINSCHKNVLLLSQNITCTFIARQGAGVETMQCITSNAYQTMSADAVMTIIAKMIPLSVAIKPSDADLIPGYTKRIMCQVLGKPAPQYKWFRNESGSLREIQNSSFYNMSIFSQNNTAVLEVTVPSVSNLDGSYLCQAQNAFEVKAISFMLFTIENITLLSPPKDASVTSKNLANVDFSCSFSSYPPSTVTWYYKPNSNQSIKLSSSSFVSSVNGKVVTSNLTVVPDPLQPSITTYECIADNGYNSMTSSAIFQILSPPKITTPSQTYSIAKGSNLVMHCNVEGFPVPRISWQFVDEFSIPTILTGATVKDSGETIEVKNMNYGGTFTCFAVNSVGRDDVQFPVSII